ncbi:SAGA-associated factor 11-like protein [Senna tora]|uniref:SAGA-associated factor 11 n=1 Tax=Senna tora TaxID=362788 RepID=A0A834WGE6_9FABA|nr:SAGA-associated factor 11-like protein [Senna tora]
MSRSGTVFIASSSYLVFSRFMQKLEIFSFRRFPWISIRKHRSNLSQILMSVPNEENAASHSQLSSHFFLDILDSIIVDVASEYHRIARLGLDRNLEEEEEELKLSAQARVRVADPSNSNEVNGKYVVDIFGQTHPPVANEIFSCMNCGRSIMAGRFAPHLEKCMGKGRKARLKVTRSSTAAQNRYSRGNQVSTYSPYSGSSSTNRLANGTSGVAGEEYSNGTSEP